MTHPKRLRDTAVLMRKSGASYTDIAKKLGLGKSTVRYMVRGIVLTEWQKRSLGERRPRTHVLSEEGRRRLCKSTSKHSRQRWSDYRSKQLKAAHANLKSANLTYRSDELLVKKRLEELFKRSFNKEQIGKRVVDFACEDLIIEHSSDSTKGLNDMISRFEDIQDDPRRKIAFVNMSRFGSKRRRRLVAVVDEIRSHDSLKLSNRE